MDDIDPAFNLRRRYIRHRKPSEVALNHIRIRLQTFPIV
jgi:hypothetical protein